MNILFTLKKYFAAVNKEKWSWFVTLLVPAVIMLIPENETFTYEIKVFSAITIAAIFIFAFGYIPQLIAGLILPIFYNITNLAPTEVVFSPWTSTVPWMFMGGMILSNILMRTGLLKRIAYVLIEHAGNTYYKLLLSITLSGFIMNFLAPGESYIPMAMLTYGICAALKLGKSSTSAGIMLTGFFSSYMPKYFIYSSEINNLQTLGSTVAQTHLTFFQYFYHNIPSILWIIIIVFVTARLTKPEHGLNAVDHAQNELAQMGPMSKTEKKTALVSALVFVYFLTSGLHHLPLAWGFPLVALVFFLPGIKLGKPEDLTSVNFGMIVFIASCLSIGYVANYIGFGSLIAGLILPHLSASNVTLTLMIIWAICVVTNLALTPLAIWATYTVPFVQAAQSLGINALVIYYQMYQASCQVLFPYEWALPLFYFSFGLIKTKDYTRIFGTVMVLNFFYMLLVYIPYWRLIGLI